jgi:octaprenyl-diphosphate synthase
MIPRAIERRMVVKLPKSDSRIRFAVKKNSATLLYPMTAGTEKIFDSFRRELAEVNTQLKRDTDCALVAPGELRKYLRINQGWRFRQALLLLSCKLSKYQGPSAVRIGTVVEIIQIATLAHNNVADKAATRRRRGTAKTHCDNTSSVLIGDWLYMQAFNVAVQQRNYRILDVLTELAQRMVQNQLSLRDKLCRRVSMNELGGPIYRNEGYLFSVCMRLGAILGEASPDEEEKLARYGSNLGMAFKIANSLPYLAPPKERIDNPWRANLRSDDACMTAIDALNRSPLQKRRELIATMWEEASDETTQAEILRSPKCYESIQAALAQARKYAVLALDAIRNFPDSQAKGSLLALLEFAL